MDNLQYNKKVMVENRISECFKPYYKWITFNTQYDVAIGVAPMKF